MSLFTAPAFRCGLILSVLVAPVIDLGISLPWPQSRAIAEPQNSVEKETFEAAKELGTVEAWDAFLSNYPNGFHADLARAYVKKLAGAPPPAVPAAAKAPDTYPAPAGSWGGVVRDGPGQNYRQVDSLQEGDPVTLLGPTEVIDNGYPWFRITYPGGGSGFQWGGILCSTGVERPDLFKTCTTAAQRQESNASRPQRCRDNGGEWDGDQCRPKGTLEKSNKESSRQKQRDCGSGNYFDKQKGRCMSYESQENGRGELNDPPKVKKTGKSCKELKARCSKTDTNEDCDRYLNSCTGKGDN